MGVYYSAQGEYVISYNVVMYLSKKTQKTTKTKTFLSIYVMVSSPGICGVCLVCLSMGRLGVVSLNVCMFFKVNMCTSNLCFWGFYKCPVNPNNVLWKKLMLV